MNATSRSRIVLLAKVLVGIAGILGGLQAGVWLFDRYQTQPTVETSLSVGPESLTGGRSGGANERVDGEEGGPPSDGPQVTSDPPGAEVFWNWQSLGFTPLTLASADSIGTLVVARSGFRPVYRDLQLGTQRRLHFGLEPDTARDRGTAILSPTSADEELMELLERRLSAYKLNTIGVPTELAERVDLVEGSGRQALLAWARARYGLRYLLTLRSTSAVNQIENHVTTARPRFRADVRLEAEVFDLRPTDRLGTLVAEGSGTTFDRAGALGRARREAVTDFARRLTDLVGSGG